MLAAVLCRSFQEIFQMHLAQNWPGKSDALGCTHAALWHMLDVAAVAQRLIPQGPLAALSAPRRNAILFLIALHDCGKISGAFRDQIEKGKIPADYSRHWRLSDVILRQNDAALATHLGGDEVPREILYAAVAGHHGRPPRLEDRRGLHYQKQDIGPEALADTAALIDMIAPIFAPASLDGVTEFEARRLSWLVSGLTVQADWIGSNSVWFPFTTPDMDLLDYWAVTKARAATALAKAGLRQSRPSVDMLPETLVGGDLRPMQAAVAAATLPTGPCLVLIEDTTGTGKTEAALILAHRMIAAGKAGGLYFALPTMATAEAMFARLRPMLRRMFDGAPSLALSHGRRALSEGFAEVKGNRGDSPSDAACAAWIADDRRLSLLAEIGVGTIDQALMAVLPTRFNTLRLAALADRVLIVDEAHAYDPYMEEELQTLLRFHAMLGGSAIVMTATLPLSMRDGFAAAFRAGLSVSKATPLAPDYPALSVIGAETSSHAVLPVPATCRIINLERLPDTDSAMAIIFEGSSKGAACLWVRNAVDDAIAAVGMLREAGIEADLLHARFAMSDRLRIEARVLDTFGKDATGRAGKVLVATQVVEASLDLDFDLMVSDLAPVGALIQRAGRLWRHMDRRPTEARPVPGPCLHVLSPDPGVVPDARWLHRVLEAGAWVYPQDVQWRSAAVIFAAGRITAPDGLRTLIEAVYGTDLLSLPAALESAEMETLGTAAAHAGQARLNLLNPVHAYSSAENIFPDDLFPTRLGEQQMTLVLTRRTDAGLVPWAADANPIRAEALSEVQISLAKYRRTALAAEQDTAEIAAFTRRWKDWERAAKAVAPVGEDGRIVEGLRYDLTLGLLVEASNSVVSG